VQSLYGVGLNLIGEVVFLIAGDTTTKLAQEYSLLVEFVNLKPLSNSRYFRGMLGGARDSYFIYKCNMEAVEASLQTLGG
jgi:hypothetical protein